MTNKEVIKALKYLVGHAKKEGLNHVDCVSVEALDIAINVIEERPQGEWIPVSERMPEYTGLYLVSIDDLVTTMQFDGTDFRNKGGVRIEVSAWQYLPVPYKKGGSE